MEQKMCALYGCNRPVLNWRRSCCSLSHQGAWSAKKQHGTENKPNKTKQELDEYRKAYSKARREKFEEFKKSFVGPLKPKFKHKIARNQTVPKPYKDRTPEQKGKWVSYVVERRKKRDKSMPAWANKKAIQQIYIEARQLSEKTGIPHEVDHIIPSNNPLVCGLHVESNLQIITEKENQIKSAKFII